ncbi:MAG: hypothetical protein RL630_978 [Verrucomicrobiota bacterium]
MSIATASLGEIAEVAAGGGAPQDADAFTAEGTPFIRAGSLNPLVNGASESTLEQLTDEVAKKHRLRKFPRDTVVFAKSGMSATKGHVYRLRNEAYVVNHLAAIVPTKRVLPEFLEHSLRVFSPVRLIQDAAYPSVRLSDVATMQIPLPPLAEQRRIAEVLDKAEALRAKRRAAIAQLDSLTQSLFFDLFGDPVANSKGWTDSKMLGDVADIVSGITKGRKVNGEAVREVPYLAVVNVQDKSLNLDILKMIEATAREIDHYKLIKNDLLLTEGGDPDKLGRGTLWNDELPECIHQNHIFRVRLTSSEIDPLFLNWLVGSQRGKKYFLRSAKQTTGIASINMTQLRSFPLLIPPLDLQHEFARRVAAVEKLKTTQRAALAELDALFASLQHRAFRGEL